MDFKKIILNRVLNDSVIMSYGPNLHWVIAILEKRNI